MNYDEFIHQTEQLNDDADAVDIYISPDFQSDKTGGYPTSLCVNWDKGKAWLQLNETVCDVDDISKYQQLCADFGIRDCNNTTDFNNILHSLGEDAEQSAYFPNEDDFTMTF